MYWAYAVGADVERSAGGGVQCGKSRSVNDLTCRGDCEGNRRCVSRIAILGVMATVALCVYACHSSTASPKSDRQVLLRRLGMDIGDSATNIHVYQEELMTLYVWARFDVPTTDIDRVLSSSSRSPSNPELGAGATIFENMLQPVPPSIASWWVTKELPGYVVAKKTGEVSTKWKYSCEVCVVRRSTGEATIWIRYSEDS